MSVLAFLLFTPGVLRMTFQSLTPLGVSLMAIRHIFMLVVCQVAILSDSRGETLSHGFLLSALQLALVPQPSWSSVLIKVLE